MVPKYAALCCVCAPSRSGSSRRVSQPEPISCLPAANGCTTGAQVRLYSRPGNDLTRRFPLIVETLGRLRSRSCIIDGEAVACDDNGVASFNLIRYRRDDDSTFLYAFDLIELNGDDLRRDPLEVRKATLASIVARPAPA
jgi:ATP-dependent DNA ligase